MIFWTASVPLAHVDVESRSQPGQSSMPVTSGSHSDKAGK